MRLQDGGHRSNEGVEPLGTMSIPQGDPGLRGNDSELSCMGKVSSALRRGSGADGSPLRPEGSTLMGPDVRPSPKGFEDSGLRSEVRPSPDAGRRLLHGVELR